MSQYKAFNPINYVIALYNPHNTPLIDSLSFMLGRWRTETLQNRKQVLSDWLDYESKDFEPVFEKKSKLVEIKEQRQWIKKRRLPSSMDLEETIHNLEKWIKREYGNLNFIREGGDDAFEETSSSPYGGEIWLSGKVRRRGNAVGRDRFVDISIAGPFQTSRVQLANIDSTDTEHIQMSRKHGYANAQYVSAEIAALLYHAKYHREKINNLENIISERGTDIWLPINPLVASPNEEKLPILAAKSRPPLSHLMMDSMVAYLTRGRKTKYQLNKALNRIPVIYDPSLTRKIETGKAGYIPIAEKWIFSQNSQVSETQRAWYGSVRRQLSKEGYALKGLVIEKANTAHETVAIEYVHKDGKRSARMMFFDDAPPLLRMRKTNRRYMPKIFEQEKVNNDKNSPFSEIFTPKPTFDDRTRRYTHSEIILSPPGAFTPESMLSDYRKIIAENFEGGLEGFGSRMYGRLDKFGKKGVNMGLANRIANN